MTVRTASAAAMAALLLGAGLSGPASADEPAEPTRPRPTVKAAAAAPASAPTVVREERLTGRLREVTVRSQVLGRDTSLRVLLPRDWSPGSPPLPVLWLLHGGNDDFRSWTLKGAAEAITEGLPLVVVMPDTGPGGWYSDWLASDNAIGPQRWESLHVQELRTWVEQRYGTRTDRAGRSVVGLSMGGFGATHYAARHPDLYGFAAAFSGAVDILSPPVGAVTDASPLIQGGRPGDIWGNRVVHEANWRAHNPVDLAENLRTVEFQLRTGNGLAGGPHGGGPDPTEVGVHEASASLHARLQELAIPHLWQDRGPGAHDWPYWQDDLRATLPRLMAVAAQAAPAPRTVEHLALESSFSVWGWDVALDRTVLETTRLAVRPGGFRLTGTGRGRVLTPPSYAPGSTVRASGPRGDVELVADGAGRLAVPVDLGPPSLVPEYPLRTQAVPRFVTVDVSLAPVAAPPGRPAASGPRPQLPSGPGTDRAGRALPATGRAGAAPALALLVLLAGLVVHRRAPGRPSSGTVSTDRLP